MLDTRWMIERSMVTKTDVAEIRCGVLRKGVTMRKNNNLYTFFILMIVDL